MSYKSALIAWGGWDGHTPEATANVIKKALEANNFSVTMQEGTHVFADPYLHNFDLIVPIFTGAKIQKTEVDNLVATIAEGTGLAGCHSGMCNCFRDEPQYQFVTGGQWVSHPGNLIDYTVDICAPNDPIMSGLEDFNFRSEQYYMHIDPAIEVLATTTFTDEHLKHIKGVVMPVVWKHRYYKAKIFYCSLGHNAGEFVIWQLQKIMERGFIWAAR